MVVKMKRFVAIIVLVSAILNPFSKANVRQNKLNPETLYSLSAVLIDGDSGRVLYGKRENVERAMASTTKIMTLILALEYGDMEDIVFVSAYAARMPEVKLGIKKGEQYKLKDLIYAMMLESDNDCAVAIAEHLGGEAFADMMNKKARELGLTSTYFITPNGIDAKDENGEHRTTAKELALLMKYCIMDSPQKENFINICQTREYSFKDFEGKRSFTVTNKNSFLDMMDGVIAGKTGFTTNAGYCYTAALKKDDRTFIIALLGCGWPNNKSYKWSDAKKLFQYGIDNYDNAVIIDEKYITKKAAVKDGIKHNEVSTFVNENINALISDSDKVLLKEETPKKLKAPIKKGDIVGCIDIYINDEYYASCNICAAESVDRISYIYYLKRLALTFLY